MTFDARPDLADDAARTLAGRLRRLADSDVGPALFIDTRPKFPLGTISRALILLAVLRIAGGLIAIFDRYRGDKSRDVVRAME